MSQPKALDLTNIQGDILSGLPKKTETYVFFQITNVANFRKQLQDLVPLIKSTDGVLQDRRAIEQNKANTPAGQQPTLIPLSGVNISFSRFGLDKLGLTQGLFDSAFENGQLKDAGTLGDPQAGAQWESDFRDNKIDGMILVSGDSHDTVDGVLVNVRAILQSAIGEVTSIVGDVRPGDQDGHEHFGFLDGISNPSIIGFDDPTIPGPHQIKPGFLLIGEDGDSRAALRPDWADDGSFLVFRYLLQRVPEFDDFLEKNPVVAPNLSAKDGSELRGARMVGRWKSGAPIDLAPAKDDPALAADVNMRNNFSYKGERLDQSRCPFAAHVRKSFPRDDLEHITIINTPIDNRRIMRRGIPFGPEVSDDERQSRTTKQDRGLLFVCYSSSITDGFQFIQQTWANDVLFPPVAPLVAGFDAIIGQGGLPSLSGEGTIRELSGTNPGNLLENLRLPDIGFVVPGGGEYFFTPSISALKNKFALPPA